jgi:hypothetical protein
MNHSNILVATAALLLAMSTALAAPPSLPLHKPGLWQQTVTEDGKSNPTASSQICYDAASEAKMVALGDQFSHKNCQSLQIAHNPDGSWSLSGTCTFQAGWKTTSHALLIGDFDRRITSTIDARTTGAPAPGMNGAHHTVLVQTRLGRCKPGQKGGDIVMRDGTKMNILDAGNSAVQNPGRQ